MSAREFDEKLTELLSDALSEGVPAPHLIGMLAYWQYITIKGFSEKAFEANQGESRVE